jgi:hypothetical protein
LESTTPVSPPRVKRKIKPRDQSIAPSNTTRELEIVASQLKTLIPVGIAIIMVAAVK